MRLSRDDLYVITKRKRPHHQAEWFVEFLGVNIPSDSYGPILTLKIYEALLAKRLGVPLDQGAIANSPPPKGAVRLREPRTQNR